jgi:glycine oxidase
MHTVIAGNGIVALGAAFRLAARSSPGDRITIVGKTARPGSGTLAAAAMLNSFAEIEVDTLDSELGRYRFELSRLATQMWPRFITDIIRVAGTRLPAEYATCLGPGGGCFDRGTYIVNNTAADQLDDENFDAILTALKEFDEPHEQVSPRDIPNYKPEQRYRATRAVYIPNEGWLNPRLTLAALEAALAIYAHVRVVDDEVKRFVKTGSRIESALLEGGGRIEGDKFLLATGATATDLLRRSDLGIAVQRIFYGVGVSIEIMSLDHPHKKCIRTPNRGLACGVYSAPYFVGPDVPHNHILIGASNHILPDPCYFGRLTAVESLTRAAIEQINAGFYSSQLIRINVGWRPTSLDTLPVIGTTSIPNLIIATGTKRDGFHLSPLLSEYITAMILGEAVDERFEVFAPERKPIREYTREGAIAKAVRHQVSVAYQHGFSPSKSRMPEELVEMYRADLERLHDRVGAYDWGIPPEMIEVYRKGQAIADGSYPL